MSGRVRDDRSGAHGTTDGAGIAEAEAAPGDESPGIHRLYTTALIADVLGVPPAAVRHWVRGGLLQPVRRAGSLEWFDFPQLVAGRHYARLLAAGLSLREIDVKLADFAAGDLAAAAPLADRIVADGRRLSLRSGDRLLGAGGQLQFGFYAASLDAQQPPALVIRAPSAEPAEPMPTADCVGELLDLAADLAAGGEFAESAEALRAVLQAAGPTAEVTFMLAEVLYRAGDLTAARERYYAAIELDGDHLEARANLGCVLAELGDHELALAALEGVLRQQPDYADAHWHVAGILDGVGRRTEAARHLDTFLTLAPDSPWAAAARKRLADG